MGYLWLIAVMALALVVPAATQSVAQPDGVKRFEVVSVKPCDPEKAGRPEEFLELLTGTPPTPNRYYQACFTVRQLASFAYEVPYAFVKHRSPVGLEFYEIDGRTTASVSLDVMRLLVRQLLADRFGFQAHTEPTLLDSYTLTLARADGSLGPGAKPADVDCAPQMVDRPRDVQPRSRCARTGRIRDGVITMEYRGTTMARLAQVLPRPSGGVIVDGTGLTGVFDVTVSYEAGSTENDISSSDMTALANALEKQLGLKLVRGRGQVDTLVIDRVQRPTPN
jgi:uncharacterized protein (TIGR03435 family)